MPIPSLQSTALTIVRSLGQAFDVCHKLNPKKNNSKETKPKVDSSIGEEAEVEKDEEKVPDKEGKDDSTAKEDVSSAWELLEADDLFPDQSTGTITTDVNKDLLELNFDPFTPPGSLPPMNDNMVNGNTTNVFNPFQPMGGYHGGMAYPPLTVSNLTNLPDFPDGVDPAVASANVFPPHMALLGGPPPQQQQVLLTPPPPPSSHPCTYVPCLNTFVEIVMTNFFPPYNSIYTHETR